MDAIAWLHRLNMRASFPNEMMLCRHHFDEAFARHHDLITSSCCTTKDWWELVKDYAHRGLDSKPFEACVKHQGKWGDLIDELTTVVNESVTGRKIFSMAYKPVEADKMTKLCLDEVGK